MKERNVSQYSYCYGCSVCAASCPKKAISMHIDADGFYKPVVNDSACVNCGICLDVCSFGGKDVYDNSSARHFAAWSKNHKVRHKCTSGGISFEIGCYLLKHGYKAVVCKYNPETKHSEHYIAETEEELRLSIGSKYIQSDAIHGFSKIKKGEKFFITGTPCQIASLRRLVRKWKMEDDVVLLDFFCHGVPSYLLWQKYLKEMEEKIGPVSDIVWRNKERGWHDSWVMKVMGRYASWFSEGDAFYRMFLGNRCLGLQCYHDCRYKGTESAADIRIGDLWGRKYNVDNEGVSGVVCNTQKGLELLCGMADILHIEDSTFEIVAESQMKQCAHKPLSYSYSMKALRHGVPLNEIIRWADLMEMPEALLSKIRYYILRFPSKILEVVGLKDKP